MKSAKGKVPSTTVLHPGQIINQNIIFSDWQVLLFYKRMLLRTYLETERSEVPVNASARRKYKMLHAANSAAVIDFRRNAMVLILYEWLNVILAVLSACRFWLDRLLKAEFAEANLVRTGVFFSNLFTGDVIFVS